MCASSQSAALEDAIDDKIDIMLQWIVAGNCIGIAATKMMHWSKFSNPHANIDDAEVYFRDAHSLPFDSLVNH